MTDPNGTHCESPQIVAASLLAKAGQWVLFDDCASDFGPLSATRLAFEHRAGALTQIERVAALGGWCVEFAAPSPAWEEHRDRFAERHGERLTKLREGRAAGGRVYLVHGLASLAALLEIFQLPDGSQLVDGHGRLVGAACADSRAARALAESGWTPSPQLRSVPTTSHLPRFPWELLDQLPARLADDGRLLAMCATGAITESGPACEAVSVLGDGPFHRDGAGALGKVLVSQSAHIGTGAVLDGSAGLVLVGRDVHIGANAVVQGPCVIHRGARVSPHALIKPNTVIGPECRIGGEIGGAIVYGHSNAVHHGHIGDSIIGEWVNIGAGTCISNLLNTYGPVVGSLGPHATRMPTARTHYGGVIGDHAKVAILVALPTGFSLGVGAMVAVSRAPQTVSDFTWLTPERSAVHRLDRFLQTEAAMMARRNAPFGAAHRAFLESLHRSRSNG